MLTKPKYKPILKEESGGFKEVRQWRKHLKTEERLVKKHSSLLKKRPQKTIIIAGKKTFVSSEEAATEDYKATKDIRFNPRAF
ncbi:hypothetical protein QE152_g34861 [Popillia japonica]|uniref:Uncharacterized protein n=1 Tax=Popillia japonica TaxID=7064 RepID=A0AAW1ISH1_POPJA